MPKTLFQKSETSSGGSDFARAERARNEAAARQHEAQHRLRDAQAGADALRAKYDTATQAMVAGVTPDPLPSEIRAELALAQDILRGAGLAAARAQRELREADERYQPLAAAEARRQKQARIDSLAEQFRAQLRAAREHLSAGHLAACEMERLVGQLQQLDPPFTTRLVREADGLPVIAGEFRAGQVGNVLWGS